MNLTVLLQLNVSSKVSIWGRRQKLQLNKQLSRTRILALRGEIGHSHVPAACSWPLCWKHLWCQFELFPQTDLVCLGGKNPNLFCCFSWVRANWGFRYWKGEGWSVWVRVIQEKKTNWAEDAADLGCSEHFWSNLSSHMRTVGKHYVFCMHLRDWEVLVWAKLHPE